MEATPGSGVFNLDKGSSKSAGTSDVYDRCYVCNKAKDETEDKKLFRCAACDFALYCSAQCQRSNWKQHKPTCKQIIQNTTFSSKYLKLLNHPKLKHYLSVAIILDGKLLQEPLQTLAERCRTVQIDILVHPESDDISIALNQAVELMQSSPTGVRPEQLTAVDTGYFAFHHGLNVKTTSPSGPALDLWKLAKETQRESEDSSRAKNPVVLLDWVWNNAAMTCGLELTPEAFADARNGSVSQDMRLDGGNGPLVVDYNGGRSSLLTKMGEFIQKDADDELGLRMKMATYDKWYLLKTISSTLEQLSQSHS